MKTANPAAALTLVLTVLGVLAGSGAWLQAADPQPLFNGRDFTGWRPPTAEWTTARGVSLAADDAARLAFAPGTGIMVNGANGRTVNLLTAAEFGDVELHVEFCISKRSNSGVYLMGRYEVQVYDSYGVAQDKYPGIECGGIYPRWTNARGEFEGHSPRINASKPPGEWQTFDVIFRAPRFDAAGRKSANARFVRVTHNSQVVHENVELTGPTRAAQFEDEKAAGPLMLQGDHGPVAYRNLTIKPVLVP
jgi:hypothetical protein